MNDKAIILRIDNSSIYINGSLRLGYENSNLPKQYFKFKNELLIHLAVEQLSYDKETGTLRVRVVDYAPLHYNELYEQAPKFPIQRIEFEKMDWSKFSPLVYSYTLSRLQENFYNASETYVSNAGSDENDAVKQRIKWDMEHLRSNAPNLFFQEPRTPVIENLQTVVKVKFEEATFHDGQISFTAKLKDFNLSKEFSIENENLKKEFENIKPWFIKRIGKSFIVTVNLKLVDRQIEEANAVSEDIALINQEVIESIKTQRVLMLVKTARKKENDKSVFTNEEVFGVLDEDETESNVFNSSADNILEILIDNGLAKNVKQLEFLSRDKQSLNERLRFTLKPHFGFLFKIETNSKQLFVWELLNSHATYIWEKEGNSSDFYQFIEQEISFIKTNGREEYRRYYKNLQTKDYQFHLIEHESADLTEDERFQSWKSKLEGTINNSS
jgi:hypothetical protein